MLAQWKKRIATLSAAALLAMSAGTVLAQGHSHSHETGQPGQLAFNDGKKWATDESLREAMSRIRGAMTAALPTIHKATAEQYRALARSTNDQIAFIVKNCKLDEKADAMLHLVLADIIAGADAMMAHSGSDARKGAEKIMHALDNYGVYFDHPGWQGEMPGH